MYLGISPSKFDELRNDGRFGPAKLIDGRNWFRDRCVEAGVPGRAHGLRKAGACIAEENGATTPQLMAMFGWRTAKMIQ
jgi:hypothetical protein